MGCLVALAVGAKVGCSVDAFDGAIVGCMVGLAVGAKLGCSVDAFVGASVGTCKYENAHRHVPVHTAYLQACTYAYVNAHVNVRMCGCCVPTATCCDG